jgi:exportin-T
MTNEKRAFLEELLKGAVSKMAYGDEVEWEMSIVGEEDEEQLLFEELRKVRSCPLVLLSNLRLTPCE